MQLLILGGTADGRKLAEQLHALGISVVYSIAGLVRTPNVECTVVSGGFRQYGGLCVFIERYDIHAILDATHPYAKIMSDAAVEAAKEKNIPCWRFCRPSWEQEQGDDWQFFVSWDELFQSLVNYKSVFLTCGQLEQQQVDNFSRYADQKQLLRTAVTPTIHLPDSMSWLKAIGPFKLQDEIHIMKTHAIDVLVSKNSGGESTKAKLIAARDCNIPVFLLKRPMLTAVEKNFHTYNACITEVRHYFRV